MVNAANTHVHIRTQIEERTAISTFVNDNISQLWVALKKMGQIGIQKIGVCWWYLCAHPHTHSSTHHIHTDTHTWVDVDIAT